MRVLEVFLFALVLTFTKICAGFGKDTLWNWSKNTMENKEKVMEQVSLMLTPDPYNAVFLPLKDLQYLPTHEKFDKNKKTVIYIHGWLESGKLDLSVLAIRGAYVDRGDHNVISVDWSYYAKNINYRTYVIPQMIIVADAIAEQIREFLETGYSINNLHIVGHSLGGQMAGKIGRQLKKISGNQLSIPRIIALDPAGPGFEDHSTDGFEPISRNDGDYVQIIHTSGGKLGMLHRAGDADFYPNGGSEHPGCDITVAAVLADPIHFICGHARSWQFYQYTVRDPESFPAIRCNSWEDFVNNGTCYQHDIAYMGFGAEKRQTGKYFLQTNGNVYELSRGLEGIRYIEVNITRLSVPEDNFLQGDVPEHVQTSILF